MNRIIAWFAACAGAIVALSAVPASAQSPVGGLPAPPPAFEPQPVAPIARPRVLSVVAVPSFRFAAELTNVGVPIAGYPGFGLVEGAGTVIHGPASTVWKIAVQRVFADGMQLAGTAPLALLTIDVSHAPPHRRTAMIDFRGLDLVPQAPPGSPARMLMRNVANATVAMIYTPLPSPVGDRAPAVDLSDSFRQVLTRLSPPGEIIRAPAPAFAMGEVQQRGRPAILLRQDGDFVLRTHYRDVAMRSEASAAIDIATGMPLFVRARLFGPVDLKLVRGPVDYVIRIAVSVDDMENPVAALAPPPPPPPPQTPPPPVQAKPAAKPPAQPRPAATTTKPTPPAAAPQRPEGADVPRRLEQLKKLFDGGLITKEQYDAKQKEILGAL